ncbi:MAG: suppressor of fused domain protein, partial [Verrucomicrobia bacterium]|nr:suppressor of fused domain protein [Verrucomicrobiota bacterium]
GKTLRHHGWVGDKALPKTTGQNRDAIARHIEKVWGENQFVLLDSKQEYVEIGVHIVPATTERPYHTLITSGMSDRPMPAPEGAEDLRFAELVISLPPDWPLDSNSLGSDEFGWPLRELVWLARFPHQYGTWIMPGHTIPNGESADPYVPNTDFCCILLATPVLCEEGGEELPLDAEAKIHFYSVIPIFREEMEFKTEHGVDGLMEKLADREVCELLDLNRPNVCR